MLTTVRHLLEMIRFSHTVFALPFALLAAMMAWTTPVPTAAGEVGTAPAFNPLHLLGILICMIGARSAAMAFNRLVDRQFDAANPRTAQRHIPAGLLSLPMVILFTLVSSAIFIGGTLLFLPNPWPLWLSIPVLLFLLGYSYTKRFTSLAHFWLGIALALAPISAWIALRGEYLLGYPSDLLPAVMLGGAVFAWVSGFDMIYACQDATFDKSIGLRSIPATLGVDGAFRLAALCHLLTIVLLFLLPIVSPQVPLGILYFIAVGIVAVLLVYEHLVVRPTDLARVNLAFFTINAIISIGLFVVGVVDLLWV